MTVNYLEASRILDVRTTNPPAFHSASGYGSRIPTQYTVRLDDGRWRRVYGICWSNAGSLYVRIGGGRLFIGPDAENRLAESER